jgi:hypothetical protein
MMGIRFAAPPFGVALGAGLAFFSRSALADPATAEALFRQGRQLISEGQIAAACEKFSASQRMDPSSGTLLNLADCHARESKTATAWAEFLTAARMARTQGETTRSDEASRRARELEPTLSHITIAVTVRTPGFRLQRDDVTLEEAALASEIPVDPGQHVFSASAPGYVTWSKAIRVGANERQAIVVPRLEKHAATASATAPDDASKGATTSGDVPSSALPPRRTPIGGYVLAGAGLVATGVGAFFGVKALATYKQAETDCSGGHTHCPPSSMTHYETAKTEAIVADVGIGLGLAAVAFGAYLVLSSPSPAVGQVTGSRPIVAPWVGATGSSVGGALMGRF